MFEIGFTVRDLIRAGYAFLFAALGYIVVAQPQSSDQWKVAVAGAVAAGLSALKNLVLADGSKAKG